MTSTLRTDLLRIEGAADPVGTLPILHGITSYTAEGAGADEEMRRGLSYGAPHSLLPYTRQDGYDRTRTARELPCVVLENEQLTATFLPGYGGRLWSLVHRPSGRELLHRNPVLQPANLALRDAWLAGGVEWNLGTTGHWPLTCEPLHAARLTAPDGTPVLRMYAFERLRRLVLRIDSWLPAGSPALYVHVSVHNPSAEPTPVYWWSNIAVPEDADTRVVGPAEHAFHFDYVSELKRVEFPLLDGRDRSYPGRLDRAADYFLDLPAGERPWIAALDGAGAGLVQTSTERLRGRKLFCWGTGTGGTHWQEWLSGPGAGYLEIQAGLARTQLEHLPMPAGESWHWTEAYGLLEVDPAAVHGSWAEARSAAAAVLDQLVPPAELKRAEALAHEFGAPEEMLAEGSGWAALEIEAGRLPASPLLPFGAPGEEQAPWRALLATGALPVCEPPAAPVTGERWRALLEACAEDWHAHYHLGLLRLAEGEREGARQSFERSLAEQRTPWALRALAFLAADPKEAATLLAEAHRLRPAELALTVEALDALLAADRAAEALLLIEALPAEARAHGRIRLAEAKAAHASGDQGSVRRLLAEGIRVDNLREGDTSLATLWLAVHPELPVPPCYDFRMSEG
ncbi:hypothetical protein CFP65_7122 [Kitasatospora sp. MMS16-BH015]|uniref:DUF5107 domain-containing protein n=1 Tax=Kitasatospora sp. MMS16-BH015 TaxID=2018025 RepID=UPI000CA1135E|nr:DUF5107 domain-containing protein [Kitasatospora sp. MMS16-BH015]AUG81723.1 hypothetical protein CFP65_7122 [Kitasatospora sp. MMS16-BH015]